MKMPGLNDFGGELFLIHKIEISSLLHRIIWTTEKEEIFFKSLHEPPYP